MRRLLPVLAVLAVLRLAFHALFLPAFEGPDEPQHLARLRDFAERPLGEALAGRSVDADVVETLGAYPCGAELHASSGCPLYKTVPGAFDLLRNAPAPPRGAQPIPNVESNQPPLFYLAAGFLLRPFHPGPATGLLAARLFAVLLVALALFGPLRWLSRRWPAPLAVAGLLALLLPGAPEALARCSNDAAVFLWASLVLAALDGGGSSASLLLLLAAGPLIKLTAIPVVVFAVVACGREGRRTLAAAGAAVSLLVFPVQALRGFLWGGTLELNSPGSSIAEPAARWALGLLRSAYAFVKTTLWIGGQNLLRPPRGLVAAYGAWLVAVAVALRPRPDARRAVAHAAAAAACAAGFAVFAVANRSHYGVWGGVGGWYLWGWSPWIAAAAADLATMSGPAARRLLCLEALLVAISNAVWIAASLRFYGV